MIVEKLAVTFTNQTNKLLILIWIIPEGIASTDLKWPSFPSEKKVVIEDISIMVIEIIMDSETQLAFVGRRNSENSIRDIQ